MIYITHVRMGNGNQHEHITNVKWFDPATEKQDQSTRDSVVQWILNQNGDARVKSGNAEAQVHVVNANPPYLRTKADGIWTDNLLALPRF